MPLGPAELALLVLVLALPLAAAALAWRLAARDGRSPWGWALVALVFPPALVVLLLLPARTPVAPEDAA